MTEEELQKREEKLQKKQKELLEAYKKETYRTPGQFFYYEEGIKAAITQIISGEKNDPSYLFAQIKKGQFGKLETYEEYNAALKTFSQGFAAMYSYAES